MFLQRYNPREKTNREQLQSWNILSFDPKNTDIDEHIQKGKVHRNNAYDDTDTFNYMQRLG